ncbi:LysR family transcriptional regulator [Paraburkholderia panacisoli]|uniref:LysR family transcriptional regulator n=1 Tax=Paraburkholderia panacisoli TaxID=2603818 RepID=UPI00319E3C44
MNGSANTKLGCFPAIIGQSTWDSNEQVAGNADFCEGSGGGQFHCAGESLGFDASVISRAIADLERQLRTRLIYRSTRRMALTETGKRYLERCTHILKLIDMAEDEARDAHLRPSGVLRVQAFNGIGQHCVVPCVVSYEREYPDVSVALTLSQRMPNLLDGAFDVAIVLAEGLEDSALAAQHIGDTASILCASPEFLLRHPAVERPEDLERLACVELDTPPSPQDWWMLYRGAEGVSIRVATRFRVNVAESAVVALESGLGIGEVPAYSAVRALRDGTLVRVLPEFTLRPRSIFALYTPSRYLVAKVRTWIDHVKHAMPQHRAAERAILTASAALPIEAATC